VSNCRIKVETPDAASSAATERWWAPIGCGVLMGLSGLLGWAFHPDALTKRLS
jgi:hypothetical protein